MNRETRRALRAHARTPAERRTIARTAHRNRLLIDARPAPVLPATGTLRISTLLARPEARHLAQAAHAFDPSAWWRTHADAERALRGLAWRSPTKSAEFS